MVPVHLFAFTLFLFAFLASLNYKRPWFWPLVILILATIIGPCLLWQHHANWPGLMAPGFLAFSGELFLAPIFGAVFGSLLRNPKEVSPF